jgi:3-keto-5-aminohexanoate cleavage enzyme
VNRPFAVAVSPTGARKTRADHPNLPLTPDEIAREASRCLEAGACMIHLHVRRPNLSHSLEVDDYRAAIQAVQRAVGDHMVIQITTEAVGKYVPAQQINVVKSLKPEAVSMALREIIQGENGVSTSAAFFAWMYQEQIIPQFILYSADEVRDYFELCKRGVIPNGRHWVLFVLGRYTVERTSTAADLLPFIDLWMGESTLPWAVCAFGQNEAACVTAALTLGGHARVGFENNVFLPDGSMASDNHELVAVVSRTAQMLGFPLADADTLRDWFR